VAFGHLNVVIKISKTKPPIGFNSIAVKVKGFGHENMHFFFIVQQKMYNNMTLISSFPKKSIDNSRITLANGLFTF